MQDKTFTTSTPKPSNRLYTDFFPLSLDILPSPIKSPQLRQKSTTSQEKDHERLKRKRKIISERSMWIPKLSLSNFDKEVLQSEEGWLNDSIINAAQELLKVECTFKGFQKNSLGPFFDFDVMQEEI